MGGIYNHSDNDLNVVYKYLISLEPIKNEVKEIVVKEK